MPDDSEVAKQLACIAYTTAKAAWEAWEQGVRHDNLYEQLKATLDALYEEHKAGMEKHVKGLH